MGNAGKVAGVQMIDSMVTQVAQLLAEMFLNLCSPERHREWTFGSMRVTVEMQKPEYKIWQNGEKAEWPIPWKDGEAAPVDFSWEQGEKQSNTP